MVTRQVGVGPLVEECLISVSYLIDIYGISYPFFSTKAVSIYA